MHEYQRGNAFLHCGLLLVGLVLAGRLAGDEKKSATVIAFGDSTTAPRKVGEKPLTVYADRLRDELARRGSIADVRNAGVGGNDTSQARERFDKDVLNHGPHAVILQFGINDASVDVWKNPPATQPRVDKAAFSGNMRTFVAELKRAGAVVILMTPNPMRWTPAMIRQYGKPPYRPDDPNGFNVLLDDYAEAVREIARDEKVPLVDVHRMFTELERKGDRSMDELLLDGVHPNAEAHRAIADALLPILLKELEANPSNRASR